MYNFQRNVLSSLSHKWPLVKQSTIKMKVLVTRFEIFLSTSLTYNKVFYSAIMYVWYMTCEISTKLFFFSFYCVYYYILSA